MFSKVEKVIYIERPLTLSSLFKFLIGKADREASGRWKRVLRTGLTHKLDGVYIVTPICPLPLFYVSFFSRLNELILIWLISKLVTRHLSFIGSSNVRTILWISHPFARSQIGKWEEELVVYDCTERFSEFKSWAPIKDKIEREDVAITESADLVLAQTNIHLEQKKKINPATYLIPNAVDYDIFVEQVIDADIPDIMKIERPIIAYVGNVNYRLDFDLLSMLVSCLQYSFVFIGRVMDSPAISQLKVCDRVHFLGEKEYAAIPHYLGYADVCIIPFLRLGELGSPTKLFDYLASGKPIVSTFIPGVIDFSEAILISQSHSDFCAKLEQALSEDDSFLLQQRLELARKNSWDYRVQQIWALINST